MDNHVTQAVLKQKFTIIFNPVAGNRRHALLDQVVAALVSHGRQVSVIGTTGPGNAKLIAAQAVADKSDVIVAAGGDGTINEVVSGVMGSDVAVGIIPMGTANVLALELGLSRRVSAIASTLVGGRTRRLHLPRINGRHFLLMAGIGFDGQVVHAISPEMKRRWGKYAFVLQGLRAIASNPAQNLTIEVNDQRIPAGWAVVSNISRYGGPYLLLPDADPGAPSLTTVIFRNAGALSMCANLVRVGLGIAPRARSVTTVCTDAVRITGTEGVDVPVQIDGDAAGYLPIDITATGEFVEILAPAPQT